MVDYWYYFIYTIGSLVTLGLIWKQNRSIQNTERAFLIPVWERWPRSGQGINGSTHSFEWKFRNCGKTPAFLKEVVAHLVLIDSLESLPAVPDYTGAVLYKGDPLVPQQELDKNFFSEIEDSRDSSIIEDEYRTGGRILYAFGRVLYQDIYGNNHQTRFGVRFSGKEKFSSEDDFVVDGPKAYNKYS